MTTGKAVWTGAQRAAAYCSAGLPLVSAREGVGGHARVGDAGVLLAGGERGFEGRIRTGIRPSRGGRPVTRSPGLASLVGPACLGRLRPSHRPSRRGGILEYGRGGKSYNYYFFFLAARFLQTVLRVRPDALVRFVFSL